MFELNNSIREVRLALANVFEPLPDNLKVRGGEIQRRLEVHLASRLSNLRQIMWQLDLPEPSLEAIRVESDAMLKTIRQMRSELDKLIQEISGGPQ